MSAVSPIECLQTIFLVLLAQARESSNGTFNKPLALKIESLIIDAEGTEPLPSIEARLIGEARIKLEDEDILGSLNAIAKLIAVRKPSTID